MHRLFVFKLRFWVISQVISKAVIVWSSLRINYVFILFRIHRRDCSVPWCLHILTFNIHSLAWLWKLLLPSFPVPVNRVWLAREHCCIAWTNRECGRHLVMPPLVAVRIWESVSQMRPWVDHRWDSATLVCWWDTVDTTLLFKVALSNRHWLEGEIFLTIIYFLRVISGFWKSFFSWPSTAARVDRALRPNSCLIRRIGQDSKHMSAVFVRVILGRCSNTLGFILILYCFTAFSKLLIRLNWCVSSTEVLDIVIWVIIRTEIFFSRHFPCWRHLWALSILPCCGRRVLWLIPCVHLLVMRQHIFHVLGCLWLFLVLVMLSLLDAQVLFHHVHRL